MRLEDLTPLIRNSKTNLNTNYSYEEIKHIVQNYIDKYRRDHPDDSVEKNESIISNYILENSHKWNIDGYMIDDNTIDNSKLINDLINDTLLYGILTEPLKNDKISEIRGNGRWVIVVDNKNKSKFLTDSNGNKLHFKTPQEQSAILNQRISKNSKDSANNFTKLVNTTTPEGFRLSMTDSSAQALNNKLEQENNYISFTLRKFRSDYLTLVDLIKLGSCCDQMGKLLKILIYNSKLAVVGPVFAGKTTFLRALNDYVPDMVRLISVQQPTESDLRVYNDYGELVNDRVMIEADPDALQKDSSNNIIKYTNTLNNSIIHTLRNSPQIVSINEIRYPDEFESAVQIGQAGNLLNLTFHASNSEEACSIATNKLIASTRQDYSVGLKDITYTFNFIIVMKILGDGKRVISEISELCGTKEVNGIIQPDINMIYKYVIDEVEKSDKGTIKNIVGHHEKVGCISNKFKEDILSYKGFIGKDLKEIDPDIKDYVCEYTGKIGK